MQTSTRLVLSISLGLLAGCANPSRADNIEQRCLSIRDNQPFMQLDGNLILTGKETYILNGETGSITLLPIAVNDDYHIDVSNLVVSPDHKKAAYIETRYRSANGSLSFVDQKLMVLTDSTREVEVTHWQPGIEKPIGWFDNERLLISPQNRSEGAIVLLNPLTNERQEVRSDLLNLYNLDPISWYQSGNPLPIYNTSMSLVFYLKSSDSGMEFVLREQESGREIWSSPVSNPMNKPQWFPQNDRVLIAIPRMSPSDFEFYTIGQNGQETRLSNFSSIFRFVYINGFNLSPDGRFVGFWLDGKNDASEYNPRFAMLDVQTGQTTDHCIGLGGGPILWSPNGRQVAFKIVEKDDPSLWYTVVFDLQKNEAVKIADQEYPVGWMSAQ